MQQSGKVDWYFYQPVGVRPSACLPSASPQPVPLQSSKTSRASLPRDTEFPRQYRHSIRFSRTAPTFPWDTGPDTTSRERLRHYPGPAGTGDRLAEHPFADVQMNLLGPAGSRQVDRRDILGSGRNLIAAAQESVIKPMPAYSRTMAMPGTASVLVMKGLETALMVPSGGVSRNLQADSASTNSSNMPAIAILRSAGPRRCVFAAT